VRILNACIAGDGIRVLIGHENSDPELKDLSLVTATCRVEGEPGLGVGVLGSTRMQYAHVVSLVDHVARAVADVLRGERA
jgi:heat-inducible transcriptional repressor